MTTKTLTIRLPSSLYSNVCDIAGEIGIPISTFVRSCIEKEHDANVMENFRSELLLKLEEICGTIQSPSNEDKQISTEILFLLRALVADRNPQLIQQVQARLGQLQPKQLGDSNGK
jgi:predicted DNA-binding protein